ncbi:50S ribosomal protein L11 methyltransferase [Alteromonas sp. KS69]|jgi:ribosomal protein L11 methyltransferase|uniref:Ribosomal protein L11 methyltransferase n=1 Tax=Alteromonas naphthalenivorans TaxID=715451 RepID=F5Z400_ALTNA|nr:MULTISPECIES: 50S ribosomal protein L11 methyltransferase [Alteromonas]MBB67889.1 50S ribosomal protein L11 methyltransferase [Rickettsiales bacterium]PHS55949.1 MAG: 50S ribosomal protein L11 methyltransferase [Alteromonas sp.]AEF05725.1 ribosomal protein L11 methyltransferase [Alteromonas naphthalenivorans]MBO7921229.1 50S ribosomal protein L11 methyltransferase [Alteromonas sp. K632G]RUP82116.1 50S ribosomal protein L11 methyltransferase [Alteromonas sp. KS69]|tara:strand:- start:2169 stop:3050 length:882 start_codon:yes stop_codon:yes gene_type:complete
MAWLQLRINTSSEYAESIGDMLSANGSQAVTYVDAKDTPMYEPKPGEIMLWPDTQVVGLFEATDDMKAIIKRLGKARILGSDFKYKLEPLEDKDWEREWMDNFHPMQFGTRLWICPSWRDVPDPNAVNVMLDPGLAFGTGTHPTTALCLRWLDGIDVANKVVVDFGCGSGILALAALKLGAKRVVAIDIDPQALQATQENARRNGVEDRLDVYLPADQPTLEADVVMANILSGPLLELQDVISSYCKPSGLLVLSGILAEQVTKIEAAYTRDFALDESAIDGEWARVSGKKLA